jgi:metal-dependent hydrolase (beta-lactamase superfamily II)
MSIIFIMPMPPTTNETEATAASMIAFKVANLMGAHCTGIEAVLKALIGLGDRTKTQ